MSAFIVKSPAHAGITPTSLELMSTRLPKQAIYTAADLVGLASYCDWFVHDTQCIRVHDTNEPRTIFLSAYMADKSFPFFVTNILPRICTEFILIIASEDCSFPNGLGDVRCHKFRNCGDNLHILLRSPLLLHIYVEEIDTLHEKMSPIPIGINFLPPLIGSGKRPRPEIGSMVMIPFDQRTHGVFCLHRNRPGPQFVSRHNVTRWVEDPDGPWREFGYSPGGSLESSKFLNELANSQFCVCVNGGGMGPSHKCWEALLCGCIPIMKHTTLDAAYSHLPIVFVDDWVPDAVTVEKLEEWLKHYRHFFENSTDRKQVLQKLSMEYYLDNLMKHTNEHMSASAGRSKFIN